LLAFLRVVLSFPFRTDSQSLDRPFANLAARQKVDGWMDGWMDGNHSLGVYSTFDENDWL